MIVRRERRIIDPEIDGGIIVSERGECNVKKSMTVFKKSNIKYARLSTTKNIFYIDTTLRSVDIKNKIW